MLDTILTSIFNNFNESELQYVVLRNYENFPNEVGNDVDILVAINDQNKIITILKHSFSELGFLSKIEPMQKSGVLCKGIKIQPDDSTISLSIHIQFWVSCEINILQRTIPGFSYKVFVEQLQRELITQNGCQFYIPSKIDRFILLLRQWIFKKKPDYKLQLDTLLQDEEINSFCNTEDITPKVDIQALCEDDTTSNKHLRDFILRRWGNQSLIKNYGHALYYLYKRERNILAPIIYITGPDGAGKTSVSTALTHSLKTLNTKYKHVYSIKRNIIRHMVFFIRRKIHGTSNNKFTEDPSNRKFRFIMTEDITDRDDSSRAWRYRKLTTVIISIIDVFINTIPITYYRLRYDTVIVETSPYDIFIKYHMPEFPLLEKLFSPLFLKPTLGLLLKADAEIIAARKHELFPDEIDNYYRRIDGILNRSNTLDSFFQVRTDIDFLETKKRVYQLVSSKL